MTPTHSATRSLFIFITEAKRNLIIIALFCAQMSLKLNSLLKRQQKIRSEAIMNVLQSNEREMDHILRGCYIIRQQWMCRCPLHSLSKWYSRLTYNLFQNQYKKYVIYQTKNYYYFTPSSSYFFKPPVVTGWMCSRISWRLRHGIEREGATTQLYQKLSPKWNLFLLFLPCLSFPPTHNDNVHNILTTLAGSEAQGELGKLSTYANFSSFLRFHPTSGSTRTRGDILSCRLFCYHLISYVEEMVGGSICTHYNRIFCSVFPSAWLLYWNFHP